MIEIRGDTKKPILERERAGGRQVNKADHQHPILGPDPVIAPPYIRL